MGNNYLDIFGPFSLPPRFLPSNSLLSVAGPFWIMFAVLSNVWRPSKVIRTGGLTSTSWSSGFGWPWGSGFVSSCKDSASAFLRETWPLLLLEGSAARGAATAATCLLLLLEAQADGGAATGAAGSTSNDCRNLGSSQMQKLLNVKNSHPSNLCFKIRNPSYFFRASHIPCFHGTIFGASIHFLVYGKSC